MFAKPSDRELPSHEFARLRLRGPSFDGTGMPVEALAEITAYQAFVVELARQLYLADHPGRKRAPKGFADSLRLRITRIENASASPVLERVEDGSRLPVPDEFDEARDLIAEVVANADALVLPSRFPPAMLPAFETLGRTLLEDESMELCGPGATSGPAYTRRVRKLLTGRQMPAVLGEITLRGRVGELDAEKDTLRFRLVDGEALQAKYHPDMYADLYAVLGPGEIAPLVEIEAIAEISHDGLPSRIESIRSIRLAAAGFERLERRMADLARLTSGWLNGDGGEPPTVEAISAASSIFELLRLAEVAAPRLYPTPSGGLQLEWQSEGWVAELVIDEAGGSSISFLNLSSEFEEELSEIGERAVELLRERI